jgi:3-dehydroquinate dehydratase-2
MKFLILNGPNLNLLGKREPEIYGRQTLDELSEQLSQDFSDHSLVHYQTNYEGGLIDKLHQYGFTLDGIVINPGGYTHTSIAIRDAIAGITTPVVEVHISDITQRESFRQHSYVTEVCAHHIIGKGVAGYALALEWLIAYRG